MEKPGGLRFWELDFLRGIAIVSMVFLHACDDFSLLKERQVLEPVLRYTWQRGTAILFLLIFGVAAYLSNSRNDPQLRPGFKRWFRRGTYLLGWGMIVTLITAIFLRKGFVVFGILHLMGVGSILIYPFLSRKFLSLGLGVVFIITGIFLSRYRFDFVWLVWLGLIPDGFCSVDYFPIIPWFGYILIGTFFGDFIYPDGVRKFRIKEYSGNPIIKNLCFLGQKSLWIYLIHQPLLLVTIYTISRIS